MQAEAWIKNKTKQTKLHNSGPWKFSFSLSYFQICKGRDEIYHPYIILVVCPLWNTPWERKEEVHIHLQPTSIMPTCQIQTIQTHTHACTHAHPRRAWSFCQLCLLRLTESLWESLDKIRMKYFPLPFSFTVTFAGWVQVAGVGLGH